MNLHTHRCALTPVVTADLPALGRLFTDVQVRRYLGGPRTVPDLQVHVEQPMQWAIRTELRGFIGWVTLGVHHNQVDTEIAYLLLPEGWGQGYAREAVARVLRHGGQDLGLSRIVAETQTANASSVRLLERVGMTFERHLERFGASQSLYAFEAPRVRLGRTEQLG